MSAKRAVLTGGTGFVGANLARALLEAGHEVHFLVRPDHADWRIGALSKDVRLHDASLEDEEGLTGALQQIGPDWIFHLAAYGAYSWQTDAGRILKTNFMGTVNLVNAALKTGFEAFVNTGSSSEYGYRDHAPAETERPEPNSHYAAAKAAATLYCRFIAQKKGVHLVTLRLYSVFGPYEDPNRLIPTLIVRGLDGNLPPLTNPATSRDFTFTDDVNEAYVLAAGHATDEQGAVYNVGSGIQTSLEEAVEVTRRVLELDTEPTWGTMDDRVWDTDVWVSDNRKLCDRLGWKPTIGFEDGFRRTVDWFRTHPDMLDRYRKHQS